MFQMDSPETHRSGMLLLPLCTWQGVLFYKCYPTLLLPFASFHWNAFLQAQKKLLYIKIYWWDMGGGRFWRPPVAGMGSGKPLKRAHPGSHLGHLFLPPNEVRCHGQKLYPPPSMRCHGQECRVRLFARPSRGPRLGDSAPLPSWPMDDFRG